MRTYKYADKKIKVPPHGAFIKLYYPGTYPCLARVFHRNMDLSHQKLKKKDRERYEDLVDAVGIFQFRDKDKHASEFTVALNGKGRKPIKWKLINQ